jgi:hypothetical protein
MKYILPTMPREEHQLDVLFRTAKLHGECAMPRWWLVGDAVLFGDVLQAEYEAERLGVACTHLARDDARVWSAKRAIDRDPNAPHQAREMACGIG